MNAKKGIYNIVFGILGQALTVVFAIIVPKVIIEYYGSEVNGLLFLRYWYILDYSKPE